MTGRTLGGLSHRAVEPTVRDMSTTNVRENSAEGRATLGAERTLPLESREVRLEVRDAGIGAYGAEESGRRTKNSMCGAVRSAAAAVGRSRASNIRVTWPSGASSPAVLENS